MRIAGLVVVALLIAIGAWFAFRSRPVPVIVEDPRLTFSTPYLNVHPDVKYVGDAACVGCHAEIAGHYAKHPMGRSASVANGEAHSFTKSNMRFSIEPRDGKVFHRQEMLSEKGEVVASIERWVSFAIGSGTRGRSYITVADGFVHQSPISWFHDKQLWDLSPGFAVDQGFKRPIPSECLFCHVNHVEPIPTMINQYREPLFDGLSIGCERCHGPGILHVERQTKGEKYDGGDFTIVNPRDLKPELRESVCQQCHLQGEKRIVRRGREPFDFRPGLPIEQFYSTFVRVPDLLENYRSVGQYEQMEVSRCSQGSNGELGCISCHDPHRLPGVNERVEYYRNRCLKCHHDKGCSVSVVDRKAKQTDDSCIACHMKKGDSTSIVHAAVTDHRILRQPEPVIKRNVAIDPSVIPIRYFHDGSTFLSDDEKKRDLGIALSRLGVLNGPKAFPLTRQSLRLLEPSIKKWPTDIAAKLARAESLRMATDYPNALALADDVLKSEPGNESALVVRLACLDLMRRTDEARTVAEQLETLNPYQSAYPLWIAQYEMSRGDRVKAQQAIDRALRLDEFSQTGRELAKRLQ